MLKELFEAHFYCTFHRKAGKVLMLDERTAQGDFTLLDTNACQGCKFVCSDDPREREQLKVHGDQAVYVLNMDQVFSYVQEDVGEMCDYILEGTTSVTLVEMTCSTTDYVRGKRQKARGQLYNTLDRLFTSPTIRSHIERMPIRHVVFSWKETFPDDGEMDSVETNMREMLLMTDEVYSPDNESRFDYGFKMREIRYPDVLACL